VTFVSHDGVQLLPVVGIPPAAAWTSRGSRGSSVIAKPSRGFGPATNAVGPGFTATELTPFGGAGQPAEKGAEVIVRMAPVGSDGPTGTFQKGDGELRW
jgi:hypothetical protein